MRGMLALFTVPVGMSKSRSLVHPGTQGIFPSNLKCLCPLAALCRYSGILIISGQQSWWIHT